jgi:hypothetical protein
MKPVCNYYLGAALITFDLMLVNRGGAGYAARYRSECSPAASAAAK